MAVLLKVPLYSGTPKCGHAEIRTPHSGVGKMFDIGGGGWRIFFCVCEIYMYKNTCKCLFLTCAKAT